MPSAFLRSLGSESTSVEIQGQVLESAEETGASVDGHVKGVELVMLYDYKVIFKLIRPIHQLSKIFY